MDSLFCPFDVSMNETYDDDLLLSYVSMSDIAGMPCVADPDGMAKRLTTTTQTPNAPGANIRKIRLARQWSLAELGDRCNPPISSATIQRIEASTAGYTSDMLGKIAEALGVTVPDLFLPDEIAQMALMNPERRARATAYLVEMIEVDKALTPKGYRQLAPLRAAEPKPRRTRSPSYSK